MKIAIFGSTRGTGLRAVEEALARGHEVTAFARSAGALEPIRAGTGAERLRIVEGDAFDARAVEEAIAGQDAVLSSLGTRPWSYAAVCSAGTRNIIRAMEARGVRRIVAVSAFGVGATRGQVPWLGQKLFVEPILGREYADKEVMERELRASPLEWTIVQPVFLTNGPRRGEVRAWTGDRWEGGWFISRADVAAFALDQIASSAFVRRAPAIAWPSLFERAGAPRLSPAG